MAECLFITTKKTLKHCYYRNPLEAADNLRTNEKTLRGKKKNVSLFLKILLAGIIKQSLEWQEIILYLTTWEILGIGGLFFYFV